MWLRIKCWCRKRDREHILEGSNSNDTIEASPWLSNRLTPNSLEAGWPDPLFTAPTTEPETLEAGERCFTLLPCPSWSVSNWSLAYSTESRADRERRRGPSFHFRRPLRLRAFHVLRYAFLELEEKYGMVWKKVRLSFEIRATEPPSTPTEIILCWRLRISLPLFPNHCKCHDRARPRVQRRECPTLTTFYQGRQDPEALSESAH